ncbi:MAG: Nif3-like dinuclear metal center hexameric protein [Polyangiaceae bacterium]|nr:Nif3-like dinuclear metal center hexameric protein [Polyangiaceae bacterium]
MAVRSSAIFEALEKIAPLRFAEPWDNVGLILAPRDSQDFHRVFLTIDLTAETLQECLDEEADFCIAYHPPVFSGLKRLRLSEPEESVAVRALCSGLTVYSPHTALDACAGGMNDWLAQALGPGESCPIAPSPENSNLGGGRLVQLNTPVRLEQALDLVKEYLGLGHLRLARGVNHQPDQMIRSLAVCPGAGGSLFEQVQHADLFLTGEMRHHDVLGRQRKNSSVILTDHTNTERGYLPRLKERLQSELPGLEVVVSKTDADPLRVV